MPKRKTVKREGKHLKTTFFRDMMNGMGNVGDGNLYNP